MIYNNILKIVKLVKLIIFLNNFDFTNYDFYSFEFKNNSSIEDTQSKKEYEEERLRNLFFIKLIFSIALIAIFKLDAEQIGSVILANLFSEIIEIFTYIYETEVNTVTDNSDTKNKKDE